MGSRSSAILVCAAMSVFASRQAFAQTRHAASEFFALPDNAAALLDEPSPHDTTAGSTLIRDDHPARAFASQTAVRGGQQTGSNHQRAVQAFNRGVALAEQLQWAEATEAFEEAYRLEPLPSTLRNLGLAHRALGRYTQSIDELQQFLNEGNPEPDVRSQVQDVINEMRQQLATVTVSVAGSVNNASFTLDNRPVHAGEEIQVDPGNHVIAATAPGYARNAQTVTVQRGENRHVELHMESTGGSVFTSWWFWTIAGAVLVGGGVVATLYATGNLVHEQAPDCGSLMVCLTPQ